MNSVVTRRLRLLVALPEAAALALSRSLRPLRDRSAVDVAIATVPEVGSYLRTAGFYHVLYLSPVDWRRLPAEDRRRYAARIPLLALGPETAIPADMSEAISCLYLPHAESPEAAAALFAAAHALMAEGWSLAECVANSRERLALWGIEPAWGSGASELPQARPGPVTAGLQPGLGIEEVLIGRVTVQGDMIGGDKVVFQATGDQVIRANVTAAKIEQQAGGDQVNINRTTGSAQEIRQAAGGEQVNINRAPAQEQMHSLACQVCGAGAEPSLRFCQSCGAPLG
jgi:hypothetical protein